MRSVRPLLFAATLLVLSAASPARAQDVKATPSVPLRIQIVLSRFEGDKKVASMPYTLLVNAGEKDNRVTLRMGVSVPVANVNSLTYHDVGTNMDCSATIGDGGRYRVNLSVNHTAVFDSSEKQLQAGVPRTGTAGSLQLLRSFTSSFFMNLKDGETGQSIAATDPVTGEVMKIDVTVNVVK